MGTVPTGRMESQLRAEYLRWLAALPAHQDDLADYVSVFESRSRALIKRMGGQVASLGALADFPVPKLLELSPVADVVYDQMRQAAIQASIQAGMNATETARVMLRAGMDKSFNRLNRLARTETVSAYWKNSWDSVADLPDIVMVWSPEHGKRTCEWCLSREGLVVEDKNVRDHPQGRCTLIPTLRSRLKYKGTLEPDGSITMDPRYTQQSVAGARAKQSTEPTTPAQRDPMSGKSNPAAPSQAQPVHQSQAPAPQAAPRPVVKEQTVVPVKTFGTEVNSKVLKERLAAGDWRYVDDRAQRAVALLQNDYRAEKAVKKAAANIAKGKDAMQGVGLPTSWSKEFTQFATDANSKYTMADVRSAIEDAAHWLHEQDAVTPKVLFKGLDVPKDKIAKLFKEGAAFETDYSSFTTSEQIARGYGGWGSKQVIVRARNTSAVRVEGNPTGKTATWKATKEHMVTGKGRVTKVVDDGRTVWVDVEF